MQLTLPESIFQKAERLAQDRGFASVGEYVSELVQRDESSPFLTRKAAVEAALIEGLDSGPATPLDRADWDELARRVREIHGRAVAS